MIHSPFASQSETSGDTKFHSMDRTLKCGKLFSSTLLWCCLVFNFPEFVILENLSILTWHCQK